MTFIDHTTVHYFPGSTTTLSQDLKAGDTVVHLNSLAGWWTGVPNDDYLEWR